MSRILAQKCRRTGQQISPEQFRQKKGGKTIPQAGSDYTPLHWAALNQNTEVLQALLAKGAKIDAKTGTGVTPLMLASFFGNNEAVKELIKAKADVNASLGAFTPVYFATANNKLETVKQLVDAKARLDQGKDDDERILYYVSPKRPAQLPLYNFLVSQKAKSLND